ncbi:MAM and LDL-receptor class A domain-containing protein 1-like [Physella acuta]|uniref:MAM and LDL-receptor class A domain-containing protein 1-like n=1 Tax=Physella acuta TaxID=109671 RepID=UPI0027DCE353|nr:MAM and LDL-receptor class A domain-containing protein 1-like [Physella acuta]
MLFYFLLLLTADGKEIPRTGCNFENGFCNWTSKDNFWKLAKDSLTPGFISNKNTYVEAKSSTDGAVLISPFVDLHEDTSKDNCLKFSYAWGYLPTDNLGSSLKVLLKTSSSDEGHEIFRTSKFQTYQWQQVAIILPNTKSKYQIYFIATSNNEKGSIKLDDIEIYQCAEGEKASSNKDKLSCDFQTGFCSWYNDINNDGWWQINDMADFPNNFREV